MEKKPQYKTPEHLLNLRLRHPEFQTYLDFNETESERVRREYTCHLQAQYGPAPLQSMDVFPAPVPDAPILVFIHGGYWRGLDKKSYSFTAERFIRNNFTVCVINYRLLPAVTLQTQLDDVYKALLWIKTQALRFHGDPEAITLAGHSAGGHLALMCYLLNKSLRGSVRAICSVSGLFDLLPVKNSYLNEVLQLDEETAKDFSPQTRDLSALTCPTLLAVGSGETDLFIEQSKNIYQKNKTSAPLSYFEYDDLNHYQIVHKLADANSPLTRFILENGKL